MIFKCTYTFFLILLITLSVLGCDSRDTYNHKLNSERAKRGIPLLPENWTASLDLGYLVSFENIQLLDTEPGHKSKTIIFDEPSGKLLGEIDIYFSGNKFRDEGDDFDSQEKLHITYSWDKERKGVNPVFAYTHYSESGDKELEKTEADALLNEWGISSIK